MATTAYTASEIAEGVGIRRQTAEAKLRKHPADTVKVVGGVPARAWSIATVRQALGSRLDEATQAGGYRNAEHLLSARPERWEPKVSLRECAPEAIQKAEKLRDAMATALQRRNDTALSAAELQEIGLRDYLLVFGHKISARHWHSLFQRTLERAGANPNFQRLELYLDDRTARKPLRASESQVQPQPDLSELQIRLDQCQNVTDSSEAAREQILRTSVELYAARTDAGESSKKVKTEIFGLLLQSGIPFAPSRDALRMRFDREYQKWLSGKFGDGRRADAKLRRRAIAQDDAEVIAAITVMECEGRLAQGWRRSIELNALSEDFLSRFATNPSCKSYVPRIVRRMLGPKIEALLTQHHGERGARDNGAYVERYWNLVPSGAWYCMDDATLPVYFYIADGKGWFTLMRGQFLLAIDTRSTCILGYALMPERNYNARVIRTLITKVADEYGLPRRGFYFERGIWENSKILKGETNSDVPLEWLEVEQGLCGFGVEFKHAIRARSKPVERVIGAIQNLMPGDPGNAGRNEILAGFEHFQKAKLRVERRNLDPRGVFYSVEQWEARLLEICERYNAEIQEGKMTGGLSPAEAFEKFKGEDRFPVKFDARVRYLLAHHKRPVKVTANGITLKFGKQFYNYKSEETGCRIGETVIAWFNPETPEILAVTNMKRENAFCVARSPGVPALDASKEEMALAMAPVEQHMSYAKTQYRVLKAKYDQQFRPNVVAPEDVELGRQIESKAEAVRDEQKLQQRGRKALERINSLGVRQAMRPEEIDAAEKLAALLQPDEGI